MVTMHDDSDDDGNNMLIITIILKIKRKLVIPGDSLIQYQITVGFGSLFLIHEGELESFSLEIIDPYLSPSLPSEVVSNAVSLLIENHGMRRFKLSSP